MADGYTDYDLPIQEWGEMTPQEKDQWFKQERARRQAMRQDTAFARRVRQQMERMRRVEEAKAETIDVSKYR